MPKARKKFSNKTVSSETQGRTKESRYSLLKGVAGITAVLSLIFGLQQITVLVSNFRERQRQVEELHRVGKAQQGAGDYPAAWASFVQALKSADEGGQVPKVLGQLSKEQRQLREAQEDLAMAWLENIRISEGQKFSDIADQLVPILARGVESASGVRKADLLAYIGWAYFLKSRDGPGNPNPEQHYRRALEIDPGNPYAHAHWGHWKMWNREQLEDAKQHFSAALASGRALEYVRRIQLAALLNFRSKETDAEFLRVVNDMVKNHEKIDSGVRKNVFSIYSYSIGSFKDDHFQTLLAAVPAMEQIATLRALFYDADFDPSKISLREVYLATLLEVAGQRDEALKTWLALRSSFSDEGSYRIRDRADAAIKRLSPRH